MLQDFHLFLQPYYVWAKRGPAQLAIAEISPENRTDSRKFMFVLRYT